MLSSRDLLIAIGLVVVFSAFQGTVLVNGQDSEVTVTQTYVSDERVDVGTEVTVGFRLEWTDSGNPLSSGNIVIGGLTYPIWMDGWVIFTDTSDNPYTRQWIISSVNYGGIPRTFEMADDTPTCIFDRVQVTLIPEFERCTIGKEPDIFYYGYYESNWETFTGTVRFNYTDDFDYIGKRGVTVFSVNDTMYGITEFNANVVKITWDRVKIDLYTPRRRYNPGQDAKLEYVAYYESDLEPFSGIVEFNDTLIKEELGSYKYTVENISDWRNGITEFKTNVVKAVFDKVLVELMVEDDRISVGEKADIKYIARYAFDDTDLMGDVVLTVSSKDFVGKNEVTVWRVRDMKWFLDTFESNSVEVIWDRVKVEIETSDTRVDVGEVVDVEYIAYYEYDGTPLTEGDIELNTESYMREDVGNFTFTVAEAYGSLYDITAVDVDEATVVWDQVEFTPQTPIIRVLDESTKKPVMNGVYAFDDTTFIGHYELEYEDHPGFRTYKVKAMQDNLYGLSSFTSDEGSILYDSISVEERVTQVMPGRLQVTYVLSYDSDNSPVSGAVVTANDQTCAYLGDGVYSTTLSSFLPMATISSNVVMGDRTVNQSTSSKLLIMNSAIVGVLIVIIGLIALRSLFAKKTVSYDLNQPG